jgi:hypothetical protein
MPSIPNYLAKAEECLRLAAGSDDLETVQLFRTLAADYLELAKAPGNSVAQQQQQIQPEQAKKPENP